MTLMSAATSQPDATLAGESPTRTRYLVLAWLCAGSALAYIHRGCLGVAAPEIQEQLSLSDDEMGWLLTTFFVSYGVFQIPTGRMGDYLGSRFALTLFAIVWSLSTGAMGVAGGFAGLLVSRFINGTAQAGLFPCAMLSIKQWFPPTRRAMASGFIGCFQSVGGALAAAVTGYLLAFKLSPNVLNVGVNVAWLNPGAHTLTWQAVFIVLSIPGLIWALGFYSWFRDHPEEHPRVNRAELALIRETNSPSANSTRELPEPTPWLLLLKSRAMWCICGQQFFRAAGYIFYSTWFPKFLKESWGISTQEAGYLTSMPLIAVMLGTLIGGSLSDLLLQSTGSRVIGRKVLAMVSLTVSGSFILLATLADNVVLEVAIISIGSFCSGCGNPVAYAITMDMGGKHTASVFSTMNMVGNFGAAAFPIVAASFVYWTGHWAYVVSPLKEESWLPIITVYRASNWHSLLYLFAGIYFCAAASWIFLNPNETIAEQAKA